MFPELLKIGPVTIPTYGFLLAIGVIFALTLSVHLAKKKQLDIKKFTDFMFFTLISGLIGAKLFLFFQNTDFYLRDLSNFKNLLFEGGVFYGGLICGALFAIYYIRKHKLNYRLMSDVTAPGLALGHFFGRLGCFCAGCCYGAVAENCSISVKFPTDNTLIPKGAEGAFPRYPVQVIEAVLNLINFVILILYYLFKKKKFEGEVFILYIFNYSIIRFFVEYLRGDLDRGYVIGDQAHPLSSISTSQFISIIGLIVSIVLYIVLKKKSEKSTDD